MCGCARGSGRGARRARSHTPPPHPALRADLDAAAAGARASPLSEDEGARVANGWSERAAALQELINDSARFLAAFDVRKAQAALAALGDAVGAARAAVLPRKRFTFSKKAAPAAPAAPAAAALSAAAPAGAGAPAPPPAARAAAYDEDEYTIEDLVGATVVIARGTFSAAGAADVARLEAEVAALGGGAAPAALGAALRRARALAGGRDVRLQRCTDCTFVLLDVLRAVRADALTRCTVLTSAVAGSVLLHSSRDCVVVAAARQFRLHTSERCDFWLRARSHPIIEDCAALRFAPYPLRGAALDADLASADLGPRAASADLWRAVDDFKWHRAQRSPNWREMTRAERAAARGALVPPAAAEAGVAVDDAALVEGLEEEAGGEGGGGAVAVAAAPPPPPPAADDDDDDDEL